MRGRVENVTITGYNICKGANFLYESNKNNKYLISLFIKLIYLK